MKEMYQTITLVLTDGRRLSYTGRCQIDHINPPKVTEILVSRGNYLPEGCTFGTLPEPKEGTDVCR